ncbi:MAG TPA: class I adenylate-forming enzyme family protein, partial [Terriglobales bacterium]|nr:class I adenylate-forming enzyme family protein [Terriglobales bacterium]
MQSFYHRFLASAERLPSRISVELQKASPSTEVEAYTFAELRVKAESVGQWLRATGVIPGDRCTILGLNHPRWVMAYLGILANGAVAVPLDTAFKPAQVAKLLDDCGSNLIFCDKEHLEVAQAAVGSRPQTRIVLLQAVPGSDLASLDQMFASRVQPFTPHNSAAE